jgi:hypothetical protein
VRLSSIIGRRWQLLAICAALSSPRALALQLGDPGSLLSVDIHGFVTQGAILTTANNYLASDTTRGSLQYSELGLNFTKDLTDRLRLGLQFFAEDIGPTGNYNATLDWFYIDYRWKDWLGLRVGRVKIPFGLYNEQQDIDSARVAVLLPQSVYPLVNTNFLLAQTGGEFYGYLRMGSAGALDYHAYLGTIFVPPLTTPPGDYVESLSVPYVAGGRLMWELPVEGLRIGASAQALRIDVSELVGTTNVALQIPAILAVASAEYSAHDVLLAAEYSRWWVDGIENTKTVIQQAEDRAYVLAAYRETRWLQTGAYYSVMFPNASIWSLGPRAAGPNARQNDLAVTLRFDINAYWLVKAEGHYMFGTAGLDSSLNTAVPQSAWAERWGVFLLETTAYF